MLQTALAVAAALVSVAFAMATFERWLARRRRHELAWTVALAMFALAAFALAAGAGLGWSGPAFRAFYFFGAIANVPVLALGTVYLLGGPRRGDAWAAVVGLAVAFAAGVVAVAPLSAPVAPEALPRGSEVFGPLPRVLAAVASGGGALVVAGGALHSAWRFRRGRLLWSNLLIAAGTAVLSASGLLNSVLGEMEAFAVTLVAGISLVFAGFLVATSPGAPTGAARPARPGDPGALARPDHQELHDGGEEEGAEEDAEDDGGRRSHRAMLARPAAGPRQPGGTRKVTASPAARPSSSAAEVRAQASDTRP